jgi:PAS domain-containing protein
MENTIDLMSIFDHDSQFQSLMKRMLENAMEHSFHGIMITKAEPGYPVVYVNDAFAEVTGYSLELLTTEKMVLSLSWNGR